MDEQTTGMYLVLAKKQSDAPRPGVRWFWRAVCVVMRHQITSKSLPFCVRCGSMTDTSIRSS